MPETAVALPKPRACTVGAHCKPSFPPAGEDSLLQMDKRLLPDEAQGADRQLRLSVEGRAAPFPGGVPSFGFAEEAPFSE